MNKKAVALLLNDIHVGKDTINDFKLNWKEAIDLAIDYQINHILVGGDLFLSRSSQNLDILLAVHDAFQECLDNNISVTIIEGNHDKVDQEAARGYCHVFDSFDNVRVIDTWGEVGFGDLAMGLISYFPENGSFIQKHDELMGYFDGTDYQKRILYIHQGIRGALSQPTDDELPADMFYKWDKVLVGHYHNRCKFDNIEYIGSSRQHNFGEDEEKGYTILFSDGYTEFVQNKVNIRYKTLELSFDEINSHIKETIEDLTQDGYRVRVKILCDPEQVKSLDKQFLIDSGASKVEIAQSITERAKVSQNTFEKRFDKSGLKNMYSTFCEENNIDNKEVEVGIRYLNVIQ